MSVLEKFLVIASPGDLDFVRGNHVLRSSWGFNPGSLVAGVASESLRDITSPEPKPARYRAGFDDPP